MAIQLLSRLKTTNTYTQTQLSTMKWHGKKKEIKELKKKLTSCQHTDYAACFIANCVISFISFEGMEEFIIV